MPLTVLIYGVLAIVHGAFINLFGNFFSFSDLLYAGDGAAFFSFSYIKVRKLLIACVILALLGAIASAVLLPKMKYKLPRIGSTVAILTAGVVMITVMHSQMMSSKPENIMTWEKATQQVDESIYIDFSNSNASLPLTGLYQYTCRDLIVSLGLDQRSQSKQVRAEELNTYFDQREISGGNQMTGCLAGKNVIMIMVESLDTWALTQEYMPNLYALQQKSINFENNYTPLYLSAGTFSTEFVSMTGLIPPMTGITNDVYVGNDFKNALPNLFREAGYTARSFHAANGSIYNRENIHLNLGFEHYYNHVEMGMDNFMLDSQLISGFDLMTKEAPFFSFIITYSGHGPYDGSQSAISEPHMERARELVANTGITATEDTIEQYTTAIAHMMETDLFIGKLLQKLEESGHMDDTVLIIYGDHYGKYITDTDFLMQLKGVNNRNLLCNTPYMIYSADLQPQTVDKYVSSVDMFPTICNLFDLDVDMTRFVGDDAFGEYGGYVYWRDYSWYNGTTYFDGVSEVAPDSIDAEICAEVRRKLNASWDTVAYDYFSVKTK